MAWPLIAAAALAVAACGDDGPSLQGKIIVASDTGNASMSAEITAPLTQVGSCIGLGPSLVIWPPDTSWDEPTQTLTLADERTYKLGDELHTGGGSLSQQTLAAGSDQLAQAFTDCRAPADQEVWVIT